MKYYSKPLKGLADMKKSKFYFLFIRRYLLFNDINYQ